MRRVVIGIDVGGTTTKIVGFRENGSAGKELIAPQFVRATDPLTSVYGALGKFTVQNGLELPDIDRILMTGGDAETAEELRRRYPRLNLTTWSKENRLQF